jgi:hypothetical protein
MISEQVESTQAFRGQENTHCDVAKGKYRRLNDHDPIESSTKCALYETRERAAKLFDCLSTGLRNRIRDIGSGQHQDTVPLVLRYFRQTKSD